MSATLRIPVLVSPAEKKSIAAKAKDADLSVGEFLRQAAAAYRPNEDDQVIEGMIQQMLKSTAQASAAIDDAIAYVAASNKRLAALESGRSARLWASRRRCGTALPPSSR